MPQIKFNQILEPEKHDNNHQTVVYDHFDLIKFKYYSIKC